MGIHEAYNRRNSHWIEYTRILAIPHPPEIRTRDEGQLERVRDSPHEKWCIGADAGTGIHR